MPVIAFPATRDAKGEDLEIESIAIGPRLRRLQPELVADSAGLVRLMEIDENLMRADLSPASR
jgi:hypothetical protein